MARKYIGSFEAKSLIQYAGSDFDSSTIIQIKSESVKLSINGDIAFLLNYNDEILLDDTYTYKFNADCILALQ